MFPLVVAVVFGLELLLVIEVGPDHSASKVTAVHHTDRLLGRCCAPGGGACQQRMLTI